MSLRFGTFGAAAITPAALTRPAAASPDVEVVAVAARDPERAQRFATKHEIPRVHVSYDELLADPEIDAVYNPLPNGLHGRWTIAALEAGKHVLCEKPFTANADEARAVADVAARSDRVVMEAFHWRYHPMAARIVEVVASGELGEITEVSSSICFPLLNPRDIRYSRALAGGALMDAGCYAIHMQRHAVGAEPEVVDGQAAVTKEGVDRAFLGTMRYPNGATGRIACSMLSRRLLSLRLVVTGTDGRLRAANPLMPKLRGSLSIESGEGKRRERPWPGATYDHQLAAFVAAVDDGTPPLTGIDDAVANMTVIDAFYEAAGLEPREPTP